MAQTPAGEVTHFFQNIDVAIIKADTPFEVGDTLHIEGATDDMTFEVDSIEVDHEPVERAEPGQEVGIKVPKRAHEGSDVFVLE